MMDGFPAKFYAKTEKNTFYEKCKVSSIEKAYKVCIYYISHHITH